MFNDEYDEKDISGIGESDRFMTVFFVFDTVLENSEMHSNAALNLFKKIQSESLT